MAESLPPPPPPVLDDFRAFVEQGLRQQEQHPFEIDDSSSSASALYASPLHNRSLLELKRLSPAATCQMANHLSLPVEGCRTCAHYVVASLGGRVLRSTLERLGRACVGGTDDPVFISLLRWWDGMHGSLQRTGPTADDLEPLSIVPAGFHAALATLGRHESAAFYVAPELLMQDPELHERGEAVILYVLNCGWDAAPLPPIPTMYQLAEARDREATADASAAASLDEFDAALAFAEQEKERGNALLEASRLTEAKLVYDAAIARLFVVASAIAGPASDVHSNLEPTAPATAALKSSLLLARTPLFLNRCLVNLKLEAFAAAEWDAEQALAVILELMKAQLLVSTIVSPENTHRCGGDRDSEGLRSVARQQQQQQRQLSAYYRKALFRRALSRQGSADLEMSKEDRVPREFWDSGRVSRWLRWALDDLWSVVTDAENDGVSYNAPAQIASGATVEAAGAAATTTCASQIEKLRRLVQIVSCRAEEAAGSGADAVASAAAAPSVSVDPFVTRSVLRLYSQWSRLQRLERASAAELKRVLHGKFIDAAVKTGTHSSTSGDTARSTIRSTSHPPSDPLVPLGGSLDSLPPLEPVPQ